MKPYSLQPLIYLWTTDSATLRLSEIDDSFVPENDGEKIIHEMSIWAEKKLSSVKINYLLSNDISYEFHTENQYIAFCHCSPASYSQAIHPEIEDEEIQIIAGNLKSDIFVCGHTHLRFNMLAEGKTIINFGSVSIPGNDYCQDARYGIIDITEKKVSFIPRPCSYNVDEFLKDIRNLNFPGEQLICKKFGWN